MATKTDDTQELPVDLLAERVERVPIDELHPSDNNPNEGDVGAIDESVDAVGFYSVIFAQLSTKRIIAGEHRWRALKAKGSPVAPVVFLDVDDETADRIMVADNELPRETSRAIPDKLAALLTDLSTTDRGIAGTGHTDDSLDRLLRSLTPPDAPGGDRDAPGGSQRTMPTGVVFRIGDYSGWVSDETYQSFRTVFEAKREESGEVMLDDVLAVWLGL